MGREQQKDSSVSSAASSSEQKMLLDTLACNGMHFGSFIHLFPSCSLKSLYHKVLKLWLVEFVQSEIFLTQFRDFSNQKQIGGVSTPLVFTGVTSNAMALLCFIFGTCHKLILAETFQRFHFLSVPVLQRTVTLDIFVWWQHTSGKPFFFQFCFRPTQ